MVMIWCGLLRAARALPTRHRLSRTQMGTFKCRITQNPKARPAATTCIAPAPPRRAPPRQSRRPGPVRALRMTGRAPPQPGSPVRVRWTPRRRFRRFRRLPPHAVAVGTGTGGGLVYYHIPHRGTHRESRGLAIAALLCGPLVACRPPGDLKKHNKPTLHCSGTAPRIA